MNDLAMSGATRSICPGLHPRGRTPLTDIAAVAMAMGKAAEAAGVQLVTGDTKVVDSGQRRRDLHQHGRHRRRT